MECNRLSGRDWMKSVYHLSNMKSELWAATNEAFSIKITLLSQRKRKLQSSAGVCEWRANLLVEVVEHSLRMLTFHVYARRIFTRLIYNPPCLNLTNSLTLISMFHWVTMDCVYWNFVRIIYFFFFSLSFLTKVINFKINIYDSHRYTLSKVG